MIKDINYYREFEPLFEGGWYIDRELGVVDGDRLFEIHRNVNGNDEIEVLKTISISEDTYGFNDKENGDYLERIKEDKVHAIVSTMRLRGCRNIVEYKEYMVMEDKDNSGWNILIRMEKVTPFFDYIENKTLKEREVLNLGTDICSALEECEIRGVVHRNIKPEHIYLGTDGTYKLGDFGHAKRVDGTVGSSQAADIDDYAEPGFWPGGLSGINLESLFCFLSPFDMFRLHIILMFGVTNDNEVHLSYTPYLDYAEYCGIKDDVTQDMEDIVKFMVYKLKSSSSIDSIKDYVKDYNSLHTDPFDDECRIRRLARYINKKWVKF